MRLIGSIAIPSDYGTGTSLAVVSGLAVRYNGGVNLNSVAGEGVFGVAMPMLSFWPFLSFAPFIALFSADNPRIDIAVYILFMATSTLGAISLWIGFALTIRTDANISTRGVICGAAQRIAVYAAVWTVAFIGYRFYL